MTVEKKVEVNKHYDNKCVKTMKQSRHYQNKTNN
jgi:hypothetical protein